MGFGWSTPTSYFLEFSDVLHFDKLIRLTLYSSQKPLHHTNLITAHGIPLVESFTTPY